MVLPVLPVARQLRPSRRPGVVSILLVLAALALGGGSLSRHWLSSDDDLLRTRVGLRSIEVCTNSWWSLPADPTPSCKAPRSSSLAGIQPGWGALGRITFALGLAATALLALLAGWVATRRPNRRVLVGGTLLVSVAAIACGYAFALLAPGTSLVVGHGCASFLGGGLLGAVAAVAARDR